jgi:hypothetical protein
LIEKTIADVAQDNTVSEGVWDDLQFAGRSNATPVEIEGGITYLVEQIPMRAHIYQG